jgi:hypothetical protein
MKHGLLESLIRIGISNAGDSLLAEGAGRLLGRCISAAVILGCIFECGAARADWFVAGAQYSCQPDNDVFEISPYSTSSGLRDASEHTPLKTRFRLVESGLPIRCALAGQAFHATVRIIEPNEGNGMGGGRVDILSMNLGSLKLLPKTEYLDWDVHPGQENLIRVRVTAAEGSASIERCYGRSRWRTMKWEKKSSIIAIPKR